MSIGGVEKVIINTLTGLDYSKFDVSLFIMYKTGGERTNIDKIPKCVKISYLFQIPIKAIYQKILYLLFLFIPRIMNNFIIKENYDVIVTTKDVFSYPVIFNNCVKIMWVHGGLEHLETEKNSFSTVLKRWRQKKFYKKFNEIIFLTAAAKKRFEIKYNIKEKCHILLNPINSREIIELSIESINDYKFSDNITIVCSCRLSPEKGVVRLINATERLINEGYDFNLLILGDGPEKNKINKIISNNKLLSKNVTLLGFKENPYKYLRKSSLYVSPSLTEGFALSIAEAIILELPIMSTLCNGPSEVLENGKFGMLVENSENGLYEGLKSFILKPNLINFYKHKSRLRKNFFTYEKNIKEFEELISRDIM